MLIAWGETPSTLNINGIKESEVSQFIVARAEEIVANIIEQIDYAGLKDTDLPGGIICIGGGARLNGMTELLNLQSGLSVRTAKLPSYVSVQDPGAIKKDIIEVVSILYAGATLSNRECLEMPEPEISTPINPAHVEEEMQPTDEPIRPKRRGFFDGFTRRLGSLFSGPDDDSELME